MYLYVQFPILCHDNVVLIVLLGLGFFFYKHGWKAYQKRPVVSLLQMLKHCVIQ